jgi:hypothetical protein
VSVGIIFDWNSSVRTIPGARSHQRRMLRAAETSSPAEMCVRPVSSASAATMASRFASTASAKRRRIVARVSSPARHQAGCAARRALQRAASSASVGGVNS